MNAKATVSGASGLSGGTGAAIRPPRLFAAASQIKGLLGVTGRQTLWRGNSSPDPKPCLYGFVRMWGNPIGDAGQLIDVTCR